MIQAVMKVIAHMDGLGLSTEEKLRLLGSVARLNPDAVAIKNMLYQEGLSEEEQKKAVRVIRALIKPGKSQKDKAKK